MEQVSLTSYADAPGCICDFYVVVDETESVSGAEVALEIEEVEQGFRFEYWFQLKDEDDNAITDGYEDDKQAEAANKQVLSLKKSGIVSLYFKSIVVDKPSSIRNNLVVVNGSIIVKNNSDAGVKLIPFTARVCNSVLECDTSQLVFYKCIPREVYHNEFTVWNRSEIGLEFQCVSDDPEHIYLEIEDADEVWVNACGPITVPGYSHKRVRATYTPSIAGDFKYSLLVENLHNKSNHERINVHTKVNVEPDVDASECLLIRDSQNGSQIQSVTFDDTLIGNTVSKRLWVKNITNRELECDISSSSGYVFFSFPDHGRGADDEDEDEDEEEEEEGDEDEEEEEEGGGGKAGDDQRGNPEEDTVTDDPKRSDLNTGSDEGSEVSSQTGSKREQDGIGVDEEGKADMESESRTQKPDDNAKKEKHGPLYRKVNNELQRMQREGNKGKRKRVDRIKSTALVLPPGMEKTIVVSYLPTGRTKDSTEEKSQIYQLRRLDFLLNFSTVTIPASVRTCRSGIHLRTRELNFGDCNIGSLKTKLVTVSNICDLPISIKLHLQSKVVSVFVENRDEKLVGGDVLEGLINLPTRSSKVLTVCFLARKVNLNYEKKLLFESADRHETLLIKASNMDSHNIIYHSLFYNLISRARNFPKEVLQGQKAQTFTATGTNNLSKIDFGEIVCNTGCLRSFDVQNITDKTIKLRFSTSSRRVNCYSLESILIDTSRDTDDKLGEANFTKVWVSRHKGTESFDDSFIDRGDGSRKQRLQHLVHAEMGDCAGTDDEGGGLDSVVPLVVRRKLAKTTSDSNRPRSGTQGVDEPSSLDGTSDPPYRYDSPHPLSITQPVLDGGDPNFVDAQRSPDQNDKSEMIYERIAVAPTASAQKDQINGGDVRNNSPWMTDGRRRAGTDDGVKTINWNWLCEEFERPQKLYFSGMEPKEETLIVRQAEYRINSLERALQGVAPLDILVVPPKACIQIGVVMFPYPESEDTQKKNEFTGKFRSVTEHVWIEQLDLDSEDMERIKHIHLWGRVTDEEVKLEKRELPVVAKVAKSIMSFAQRHINFGQVKLPCHPYVKTLYLNNESALPLLYKIRKSGSFSSGFLKLIRNAVGMVRPYGTKAIQFEFHPTMPGKIDEKLTVCNVSNESSSTEIRIKAHVIRPQRFKVDTTDLQFTCDSATSNIEVLAIRNTYHKPCEFAVKPIGDMDPYRLRFSSFASSTKKPPEVGEEIEHLQHKLRIAETKNQIKKMKTLRAKLAELHTQGSTPQQDHTRLMSLPDGGAKLVIEPDATARLKVQSYRIAGVDSKQKNITGLIEIFPIKNKEAVRQIPVHILDNFVESSQDNLPCSVTIPVLASSTTTSNPGVLGRKRSSASQHSTSTVEVPYPIERPRTPTLIKAYRPGGTGPNPTSPITLSSSSAKFSANTPEKKGSRVTSTTPRKKTLLISSPSSASGGTNAHSNAGSIGSSGTSRPIIDFDVTPKVYDCGAITYDKQYLSFTIKIKNRSKRVPMPCKFQISYDETSRICQVDEICETKIEMRTNTLKGGRKSKVIKIQFGSVSKTVMVKYNVMYIHFLDLDKQFEGSLQTLDCGYCYVVPGKAPRPTPIRFKNVFNSPLVISAVSNLKRQIYIYSDENMSEPMHEVPIAVGQVYTAWVGIEPRLLEDSSRILSGGIQFLMKEVFTCTVKFKATVGFSQWRVSPELLDLGLANTFLESRSSLVIHNETKLMPLRFKVYSPDSPALRILNVGPDVTIESGQDKVIEVEFKASLLFEAGYRGLLSQEIRFRNMINDEEKVVVLRTLIPPPSLAEFAIFDTVELQPIFANDWGVVMGSEPTGRTIKNPYSDRALRIKRIPQESDVCRFCVRFDLGAGGVEDEVIVPPLKDVTIRISAENEQQLEGGTDRVELLQQFTVNDEVALVLKLLGEVKRFHLDLAERSIDVGKVLNDTKHRFIIKVKNACPELYLRVELENMENIGEGCVEYDPQLGEIILDIHFIARDNESSTVPISGVLLVYNMLNPMDNRTLPLQGELASKVVDAPTELIFPDLTIPAPSSEDLLQCNEWFTLSNTFGEDIECTFETYVFEEWAMYVTASVMLRVSNVEVSTVKLVDAETSDIRVALMPIHGARLPVGEYNDKEIGKLRIIANGIQCEVALCVSMFAGKTFSLSTSKLVFYTKEIQPGVLTLSRKSLDEAFWVKNLSKRTNLKIRIITQCIDIGSDNVLHLEGSTPSHIVIPDCNSSEWEIAPEKSARVATRLVTCTSSGSGPTQKTISSTEFPSSIGVLEIVDVDSPDTKQRITITIHRLSNEEDSDDGGAEQELELIEQAYNQYDLKPATNIVVPPRVVTPFMECETELANGKDTIQTSHSAGNLPDLNASSRPGTPTNGDITTLVDKPSGVLNLRGCTPVSGSPSRFEINVGQREYGSGIVEWEIDIENISARAVEFELFMVDSADCQWLELSKSNGVLSSEHDFYSIQLKLSTDSFGGFFYISGAFREGSF
uniref:Uncharacterized protein n=1 Tax=Mucochytrium quahogii TaxID=96639 RepID=A0A7S2W4D6_9STRA|mmetsp:Transcript_12820/g.27387  ORF Transcript_12820/g.27387 Transcript_12820/m.27387 type:complete len:2482 (+) Transcript_12820:630-8075(+)